MVKIDNCILEPNDELPEWYVSGCFVRIIGKDNGSSFFIFKTDEQEKAHAVIREDKTLDIKGKSKSHLRNPPSGYYDVLNHSKVCFRLVFNRGLDVDPDTDIPPEDIDPRTASVYDMNYWFFRQAQSCLKNKTIPRGFQDVIKVMRDSFYEMRLERKGLTQRKMETREIIVDDDDDKD